MDDVGNSDAKKFNDMDMKGSDARIDFDNYLFVSFDCITMLISQAGHKPIVLGAVQLYDKR